MSTRRSGSSTQSTGTSWMRRPARSASTSSSVSKNQPVSSTSGSSSRGDVGADRLEAALRVGEPRAAASPRSMQVVAAGDELPLRPADHPRAAGQPGADGEVGVAGDQRRDQRQQGVEVGGQVDVHVGEHRRVASATTPCCSARPRPFSSRWTARTSGSSRGRAGAAIAERAVGAGVVGDGDPEGVGQVLAQVGVQAAHAALPGRFLVVDGDHDVDERGHGAGPVWSARSWRVGSGGSMPATLRWPCPEPPRGALRASCEIPGRPGQGSVGGFITELSGNCSRRLTPRGPLHATPARRKPSSSWLPPPPTAGGPPVSSSTTSRTSSSCSRPACASPGSRWHTAADRPRGADRGRGVPPRPACVLDVMMPGLDGFEVVPPAARRGRPRLPGALPHRPRRDRGQGHRADPRRRRLRHQAVQPRGGRRPDPGGPAPRRAGAAARARAG